METKRKFTLETKPVCFSEMKAFVFITPSVVKVEEPQPWPGRRPLFLGPPQGWVSVTLSSINYTSVSVCKLEHRCAINTSNR